MWVTICLTRALFSLQNDSPTLETPPDPLGRGRGQGWESQWKRFWYGQLEGQPPGGKGLPSSQALALLGKRALARVPRGQAHPGRSCAPSPRPETWGPGATRRPVPECQPRVYRSQPPRGERAPAGTIPESAVSRGRPALASSAAEAEKPQLLCAGQPQTLHNLDFPLLPLPELRGRRSCSQEMGGVGKESWATDRHLKRKGRV